MLGEQSRESLDVWGAQLTPLLGPIRPQGSTREPAARSKTVSFRLPGEGLVGAHGSCSGGASGAGVSSTRPGSSSGSSSSSTTETGWYFQAGMNVFAPDVHHLCPGCFSPTTSDPKHGLDGSAVCNNERWGWSGEPPFCCLCASLKGMGRLRDFGCKCCKERRTKLYKKTSWFNSNCKHCLKPRAAHEDANGKTYPRCVVADGGHARLTLRPNGSVDLADSAVCLP